MISQSRAIKFIAPLFLYFLWGCLRFCLSAQIRQVIFHSATFSTSERILISHALIVLEAALLCLPFLLFRRSKWVEDLQLFGNSRQSIIGGIVTGVILFLTIIPVALYFGMKFSPQFSWTNAVGNLFSNGAEELIYRGILLTAVLSIFKRNWLSILIPAIVFGLGHWDYPFLFQSYIMVVGLILGALCLKTKSLLAPYIAHMIADLLADSFFH